MRKRRRNDIHGIEAPGPRPTPQAALLLALFISLLFLIGLGLWQLAVMALA